MPRTPSIRYFASREAYYTQWRGKQHCLAPGPKDEPDGPTYKKAVEEFSRLMHLSEAERASDDVTISALLSRYKHHLAQHGSQKALEFTAGCLDPCLAHFGAVKVRELKPYHVQGWLDAMRQPRGSHKGRVKKWGDTRTVFAAQKFVAMMNWAATQKMISGNPISTAALTLPEERRRGRDFVIPPGEHEQMVADANPKLAGLLRFFDGTGCRPGEAYNATAKHYDPRRKAIVFRWDAQAPDYIHKTAKKTKKDRVIFLDDEMDEMMRELVRRHPTGPLFASRLGNRWTNASVYQALKRVRSRLGLTGKCIAYSYRHTFATNWLLDGGSIKVLAELLGNSVAMIEKHYGHLDAAPEVMRKLLNSFREQQKAG
jgi:integrase